MSLPPTPSLTKEQTRKRRWEQRERFLWAGVQSDDILPSHLSPLARTQCCGHTACPGQLRVCPAGWGVWTGCGHLPPHPTCFHSNSKPEFTQRGMCLFLRLMTINNLRQEGRRQGAIVKSMTQLPRTGYNKNQLKPARPKMAEDSISSGPYASVYAHCITLINDIPTSCMTVSGSKHQCCPNS